MPAHVILSSFSILGTSSKSKQNTASVSQLVFIRPPRNRILVVEIFIDANLQRGIGIFTSTIDILFWVISNFSIVPRVPISLLNPPQM